MASSESDRISITSISTTTRSSGSSSTGSLCGVALPLRLLVRLLPGLSFFAYVFGRLAGVGVSAGMMRWSKSAAFLAATADMRVKGVKVEWSKVKVE